MRPHSSFLVGNWEVDSLRGLALDQLSHDLDGSRQMRIVAGTLDRATGLVGRLSTFRIAARVAEIVVHVSQLHQSGLPRGSAQLPVVSGFALIVWQSAILAHGGDDLGYIRAKLVNKLVVICRRVFNRVVEQSGDERRFVGVVEDVPNGECNPHGMRGVGGFAVFAELLVVFAGGDGDCSLPGGFAFGGIHGQLTSLRPNLADLSGVCDHAAADGIENPGIYNKCP